MIDGIGHSIAWDLSYSTGVPITRCMQVLDTFGGDVYSAREYLERFVMDDQAEVAEKPTSQKFQWKVNSPTYANRFRDRLNVYNDVWSIGDEDGPYGVEVLFTSEEYEQLVAEGMPDIFTKVVHRWEKE